MPPKANNNREAVVVCAKHVVKLPSKRMRASNHTNPSAIKMLFIYTNFEWHLIYHYKYSTSKKCTEYINVM